MEQNDKYWRKYSSSTILAVVAFGNDRIERIGFDPEYHSELALSERWTDDWMWWRKRLRTGA